MIFAFKHYENNHGQKMKKKINNQKGFTLVELIIVVAVIGILAAITAPSLNNMIDRSRSRSFARGIANQYRLARNQAASTNQAFVVRLYRQGSPGTTRGRVEVWALPTALPNCRAVGILAPLGPPVAGATRISFFEGDSIGGDMLIRRQSQTGSSVSSICVQPNGEFLMPATGGKLTVFSSSVTTRMCIGESMVIPLWRKKTSPFFPDKLFDCSSVTSTTDLENRAQYDYWRVSVWDNGQITVGRK